MINQKKIIFISGSINIEGILNESETAEKIWSSLPLDSLVNTWGDEIYFSVPVDSELENSKEVVDLGDIGFSIIIKALDHKLKYITLYFKVKLNKI